MNSYQKNSNEIKLSIGLPVYNGEKFIRKCIDSLLAQTFTNFELIISDNASTDNTSKICQEYLKKDKRIRYICQESNIGLHQNFDFVLEQAKNEFFMWIGVDDYILPNYAKKNMDILISNSNVVGSVSKINQYNLSEYKIDNVDSKFFNFMKILRFYFRKRGVLSISGTYSQKVRTYLNNSTCQIIYGIFRTDKLRKSIISSLFLGLDWAEMLNILKFGDIHIVNEVLMYEFERGRSSDGIIYISKSYNINFLSILFPWYPFTNECRKTLGLNLFLKNLDYFIKLNFEGSVSQFIDIIRLFIKKLSKTKSNIFNN
jgi:glycosyltransferase involved in cell wall biosynthesis